MTEITESKPRVNQYGEPCPPWCDAGHDRGVEGHHGARTEVMTRREGTLPTHVHVNAMRGRHGATVVFGSTRYEADPATYLANASFSGFLQIDPRDAADLAGLLEALADMSPAQLRELAAGVRAAAAAIRGLS